MAAMPSKGRAHTNKQITSDKPTPGASKVRVVVGRGENPVGPGTPVSGGVRTRCLYLNCHGRARPNTE